MVSSLLFTLLFSTAGAVTLAPIPQGPTDPVPFTQGDNYPCDQIVSKLTTYASVATDQHNAMTSFLTQISQRMGEWYTQLSPLEGSAQTIESGTFQPIQDSSDQVATVTNAAYDNHDALDAELARITVSLQACKLTALKTHK